MVNQKNVIVVVTGGIAAYKAVSFVRLLVKAGAHVRVLMTQSATEFVTPLTFATLTKHPVLTDVFAKEVQGTVPHIEWADWADLAVVVPATANIIAKMANGIADDAVSTTLLAAAAPKYVIPAMNNHMWDNPATQRNLALLATDGVRVLEPVTGMLAEGYAGKGRMPEPGEIMAWLNASVADAGTTSQPQPLTGKQVVITAGGTREYLDPVRYLGNESSGKMGIALATAARDLGATVTLIKTSSVHVPLPTGITTIDVVSTAELAEAVKREFTMSDVIIMAAAVADYRPVHVATDKIKKSAITQHMTIELTENEDILQYLGTHKTHQFVLGFAAETQDLLANATAKLAKKQADMLIANDVSQVGIGFGSDENAVTLLQPKQAPIQLAQATKDQIATEILLKLAPLLN